MSKPIPVSGIENCARCGGNHKDIEFKPLTIPGSRHTHWAACPINGEPIMMRQVPEDPDAIPEKQAVNFELVGSAEGGFGIVEQEIEEPKSVEYSVHPGILPERAQDGALDIVQERFRQRETEGWTTAKDAEYKHDELLVAALWYIVASMSGDKRTVARMSFEELFPWPFHESWWKPGTVERNLAKAGALCAAQIDVVRFLGWVAGTPPSPVTAEWSADKEKNAELGPHVSFTEHMLTYGWAFNKWKGEATKATVGQHAYNIISMQPAGTPVGPINSNNFEFGGVIVALDRSLPTGVCRFDNGNVLVLTDEDKLPEPYKQP